MKRFLFLTILSLIIITISAFPDVKQANAEAGAETLINQTQYNSGLQLKLGRIGQVFKPNSTGLIGNVAIKIGTSGNSCMTTYLRLYEWAGDPTNNPDVGRGDLIVESNSRRICNNTAYLTAKEFAWDFASDNEIILSETNYYYLEFDYDGRGTQPTWAYPSVYWAGHSDPTLIDGEAWAEYQGVWGNPPGYSSVKDLYLIINAIPDGKISIENPPQNNILPSRDTNFDIVYAEPHDNAFDSIKIELLDFLTKELLQEETVALNVSERTAGYHSVGVPVHITESGNYFEVTAKLVDCSTGSCTDGEVSSKIYFSVLDRPTQNEFILNQTNLENGDGVNSQFTLVGQVFRPENSGSIQNAQMRFGTSGNGCVTYNAKLYEWLGDRDNSPRDVRGDLLAEADGRRICSSSAYPTFRDFNWVFSGDNQVFLSNSSYYYIELDYYGRTWLSRWAAPTVYWSGSPNGSLIDGRLWAYRTKWESPQANSTAIDLYLVISGELQERDPVIIVPGIMGSRLNRVSDGEEVWPDGDKMFFSRTDEYLDELKLDAVGGQIDSKEMSPTQIIDEVLGNSAYGNLVNNFLNQGYASGTTLFTVPYDWRLDLASETDRLNTAVQSAISNSPTGKINIVAHSMGGLLVKEYLRNIPNTSFVDKLIIAGVPQLGAPKAFKAIMYGDNMGFEFLNANILNPERVSIISKNMPGVYELLPTRKYVDTTIVEGGYIKDFRNDSMVILDYDETTELMISRGKRGNLVQIADDFHEDIDSYQFNAVNVYNIMGCQRGTPGSFLLYDDKVKISPVDGDGTVPLGSAINLSNNYTNYFALNNIKKMKHMDLIRKDEPISLINDIISENIGELPEGFSTSIYDCFDGNVDLTDEKTIYISTHSPVKLHIYDSVGNHVGPNADGDIDLEIPDSEYEIIGHNNFAVLPDGDYQIVVNATDSGEFDLEIETYTDLVIENKITYIDVPVVDKSSIASMNYSGPIGNLTLKLDNDGDGITDEQIQPNAILDSNTAGDITPPNITLPSIPDPSTKGEIITITYGATDVESGVAILEGTFNGAQVQNGEEVTLTQVGENVFQVEAVDNAGNPNISQLIFMVTEIFESDLTPAKDTSIFEKSQKDNYGDEDALHVGDKDKEYILIQFDEKEIASIIDDKKIVSAVLEMSIAGKKNKKINIEIYRLTQEWEELTATWECSNGKVSKKKIKCDKKDKWEMDKPKKNKSNPWVEKATDSIAITKNSEGIVRLDATQDILDFLAGESNYGWIIKTADKKEKGELEFSSRETTMPPILKIIYE